MDTLRRYLTHYCRCDDETVARHLVADAAGDALPLPALASWAQMNPIIADAAARFVHQIVQERAERVSASEDAVDAAASSAPAKRPPVLVAEPKTGFVADMRRARIVGSTPAQARPALAARLAADHTVTVEAALATLANAPIEAGFNSPDAPAVDQGGFGSAATPMPQSTGEATREFLAIVQADLDERQTRLLR